MNGLLTIHPKVTGSVLGAGFGAFIVWLLGLAHVAVNPTAGAFIAVTIGGLAGWLAPIANAERAKILAELAPVDVPPAKG